MKGRRPESKHMPAAKTPLGEVPKWMSPESRAEWRRIVKELTGYGANLTGLERAALINYCVAIGNIEIATKEIQRDGMSIITERGQVKHPSLTALNQAQSQARQWAVELGLTPASKGKMPMAKSDERRGKFKAL